MSTNRPDPSAAAPSGRRTFLRQATALSGLAALAGQAAAAPPAKPAPPLPTIKLGPHTVTRLIIGGNPIYGYSVRLVP